MNRQRLACVLYGSRGAKRINALNNPDEHTKKGVHGGASSGKSGEQSAQNPVESGKRPDSRKSASGPRSPEVATDSGRSGGEQHHANEQRKRARRRKRGKSAKAKSDSAQSPANVVPSVVAADDTRSSEEAKPAGKMTNRRRRARRRKQTSTPAGINGQAVSDAKTGLHKSNGDDGTTPAASDALQARQHGDKGHQNHNSKPRRASPRPDQQNKSHNHSNGTPSHTGMSPRSQGETPLYAALDLGTNNCRLLIASPTRPGQFRVIDAFSRIVRLGEGLSASGRLSEQAMSRAVEALKICRDKLAAKNVRRSRLITTEACRTAENGEEFLLRVQEETGLELEIVDRQTEARLAVSGCGTLISRETDAVVLFDIGGGSSEIALIDVSQRRSPRLAEHIIAWTSLPVGVVTLAERFGGRNVTNESFAAMVDHVSQLLAHFTERHQLGELARSSRFHLLGTSGTVTTLAGIHLGLERYDRRRVDGMWMGSEDVTSMTSRLLSWDFDERVANPCIGADRADLVLAGCAILDAIRIVWPSEKLLVADRGLREGILTELMSRDGAWRHNRSLTSKNRHLS